MHKHKLVVIGGSAGAVEGLHQLFCSLPGDFPLPICAVIHVSPRAPAVLANVLGRRTRIKVTVAEDGAALEPGVALIAPPDRHLIVTSEGVKLTIDAKENRQRPAVDALFRTAARLYGADTIGVILSGALDDGAAGLQAIKEAGGVAIVQSPADALIPDMPRNALARAAVDYAVPLAEMGAVLDRLARQPLSDAGRNLPATSLAADDPRTDGKPSLLACPDCNGTLWEINDGETLNFRCRVGHSYSLQSLLAAQDESIERALWTAVRVLEETAALSRRLEEQARGRGHRSSALYFADRAEAAERDAMVVRNALENEVESAVAAPQTSA